MKDTKIFLKKKKTKGEKRLEKDIKILLKKKKEKGVSIIRNVSRSYLRIEEQLLKKATKKQLLRDFVDFLKIQGQLKKYIEFPSQVFRELFIFFFYAL